MEPEVRFKAREMPKYKFFHPEKDAKKRQVHFADFELSTMERSRIRSEKENKED